MSREHMLSAAEEIELMGNKNAFDEDGKEDLKDPILTSIPVLDKIITALETIVHQRAKTINF